MLIGFRINIYDVPRPRHPPPTARESRRVVSRALLLVLVQSRLLRERPTFPSHGNRGLSRATRSLSRYHKAHHRKLEQQTGRARCSTCSSAARRRPATLGLLKRDTRDLAKLPEECQSGVSTNTYLFPADYREVEGKYGKVGDG